jgi:hypothetical protein
LKYLDGLEQDPSDEPALGDEKHNYVLNKVDHDKATLQMVPPLKSRAAGEV